MQETLTRQDSGELISLWQRRHGLSPEEMGRMYSIVSEALRNCNPPELHALGEGRSELVAQFIYIKVLRLDADLSGEEAQERTPPKQRNSHSAPSNAFALCAYFRRYLIDCTRASSFRRKISIGDEITEDQLDLHLGPDENSQTCLGEHGLDAAKVHAAARQFIATLEEPERLLLCEGFGQETAGGLSGVAARHAIASYHYRAGRLGLVHKREALPADYARTRMGDWIQNTLGICIEPSNMTAILNVFKILGAEASYS